MRQRGFGVLAYLIAAGVVIAALAGLYALVDGRGYARGAAEKQAQWDKANEKVEQEKWARAKAVSDALTAADLGRAAAQARASDNHARWQEAKREAERRGSALAVCNTEPAGAGVAAPGEPAASPVAAAAHDRPGLGIRFTWDFVRLYDGAWTGQAGEPVFRADAWPAGAAGAGAVAPYGAGDILDVHGENARRCSEDRREFRALMNKIEAAAAAFDRATP